MSILILAGFKTHLQLECAILKGTDTLPFLKIGTKADILSDCFFLANSTKLLLILRGTQA